MAGWIKIQRALKEWEWYGDSYMVHLLIHMVLSANHEDKVWRGVKINRGQFISSRDKIAQDTGISPQSVRTCLERLKSTSEIRTLATSQFTLYTVVNYDKYQTKDKGSNQQSTSKLTNGQPAINQQSTTTKNEKNYKNYKEKSVDTREEKMLFEDLPEIKEVAPKRENEITLQELGIEHIEKWLSAKRVEGLYVNHDPVFVLEQFKDYCAAKEPKYKNYVAAYRSAFEWDRCKPKVGVKSQVQNNIDAAKQRYAKLRGKANG